MVEATAIRAAVATAVATALARLSQLGQPQVVSVELAVGVSGHVTEAALRQAFALYAAGTPLEHAQVHIVWAPTRYQCFDCLCQFTSSASPEDARCPECGGIALEIDHDGSCYIQSLDLAEPGHARE